jgi:hypothetical protein
MSDTVATLDIGTLRVRSISLDELPGISDDEWLDASGRIQFADGPPIGFRREDGRIVIDGFETTEYGMHRTVLGYIVDNRAVHYEVDDEKFRAMRHAIWNILATTEVVALSRVRKAWVSAWDDELAKFESR